MSPFRTTTSPSRSLPDDQTALAPYLTETQKAALHSTSAEEIEYANEEALQMAIAASLSTDERDTDAAHTGQQKVGLQNTSNKEIEQADDEALQLAIAFSLSNEQQDLDTGRKANQKLIDKLKHCLSTQGLDVKPNSGNSNNCLIISMLQHVTGDYHSNHVDMAAHYKQQLAQKSGNEIETSHALHSDTELTSWLIDQINHDYFGQQKDRYVCFWMVTADLDGKPAVRSIGEGQRAAAILDGAGHYEAVVARDIRSARRLSHPDKLP